MTTRRDHLARGHTLLELMIATVIMGILAASVIPTLEQNTRAQHAAARDEVARLTQYARTRAVAGGTPVGVGIDTTDSTIDVRILDAAGTVVTLTDPIDGGPMSSALDDLFGGARLTGFVNGDGDTATGIAWFDPMGEPHTRTDGGDYDAPFSADAVITVETEHEVVIHAYSGMVEVR